MKKKIENRKRIFSLKKPFYEALNYIKESRNYIYFIVGVFFFSALFGFFYSEKLSFFDEILKNLIDRTEGLDGLELMSFIFNNNALNAFMGLFFGVVLGIFSIINAGTNGAVLGYVFSKVYAISGFNDFWRILPHGIFELPAIFISLGLGIKFGTFIFSKNIKREFVRRFYYSFLSFVLVIIPLLVVAAIIEGLLISLFK